MKPVRVTFAMVLAVAFAAALAGAAAVPPRAASAATAATAAPAKASAPPATAPAPPAPAPPAAARDDTAAAARDDTAAAARPAADEGALPAVVPPWLTTIRLMGTLESESRWSRHGLDPAGDGRATSALYLRRFELAVSSDLAYWAEAFVVVNTEYVDDPDDPGDGSIVLDEGHLDLASEGTPWTLVAGRRTQPFGVFEAHLVTDPITQDGYETKEAGLTAGWQGLPGGEIDLTVYEGAVQMAELQESRLLDGAALGWTPTGGRRLQSWIATANVGSGDADLDFQAAFLSEPGARRRNLVLNLYLHAVMPGLEAVVLDGEWMRALQREDYPAAGRAYEEGALTASLTYRFVVRDRRGLGQGNFKARRQHLRTHPLELTARYEHFQDDGLTRDLGVWTLRDRWSAGGRYTFVEGPTSSVYALLEVQRLRYREPAGAVGFHDADLRVYGRFGMSF